MSPIVVAGLGIRGPGQVTDEVRRALAEADVVFHTVADERTRSWVESIAAAARDVNELYVDGRPRIDAYRLMAQRVLETADGGEPPPSSCTATLAFSIPACS